MDMEIALFLVVFLLTSSVATVAICCLELKAVWISYRDTKTMLTEKPAEPECTCRLGQIEAAIETNSLHGKYTRRESFEPNLSRQVSASNSPKYSREASLKMNWSQDNGVTYSSRHNDNGLDVNNVRENFRPLPRIHSSKSGFRPVPI